ncbi:hypothetical protein BJY04DRAFT_229345 [Aspergillus karnatakaensis]|uniref:flavin-containing monooxygenase n=1 Tax=Aspergillus karnatakaensis TaxID=1810916 RepID=UPI003CCD60A6
MTSSTFYQVVIIGAGAGGIAAACLLKKRGIERFRVYEREPHIGGTWWTNRYPGVVRNLFSEAEQGTALYSFSFAPNYQSKTIYPSGADFVEYLVTVVQRAGISDKFQLASEVRTVKWVADASEWELHISHSTTKDVAARTEIIRAEVVISAIGILKEPIIHSARWPADVNLGGKRIVVVGSGCSAAQIVPTILQNSAIESVTQIMRTPPWVIPRLEEPGGQEVYAKWAPRVLGAVPFLGFLMRMLICFVAETHWFTIFKAGSVKGREQAETVSCAHMVKHAPTQYHSMLRPSYPIGCKRRVVDSDWLKSMHDSRFTLAHGSLVGVQGVKVLMLGPDPELQEAATFSADTMILATGFDISGLKHYMNITGREGMTLQDVWAMRGGPNTLTGHTSVIMMIENTLQYILRMIQPVLTGDVSAIEPKPEAVQRWTQDIRRDTDQTNVALYPWVSPVIDSMVICPLTLPPCQFHRRSQLDYYFRCCFPRHLDWKRTLTQRGQSRQQSQSSIEYLALATVLAALLYALL